MKTKKTVTVDVERLNRQLPGRTFATQPAQERAFLRQCKRQGIAPLYTTPEGEGIGFKHGACYYAPYRSPSGLAPLSRTTIAGATVLLRWMLANCARVTTHERADDMASRACQELRSIRIGIGSAHSK